MATVFMTCEMVRMMAERPLEAVVGEMLREQGLTLALAESSTGGLVGHRVTEIAGSSAYFRGSIVPYARDLQESLLGVSPATLETFGVVSAPVAREMAAGARRQIQADIGLSVTGIAGPSTGRRSRKPVGLTYIGLAVEAFETFERHLFAGDRSGNKRHSAEAALDLLRRYLERNRELPELEQIVAAVDPTGPPQIAVVHPAQGGILEQPAAPTRQGRRLGVFSSSFNPMTAAHARIAELALEAYQLDEVMFELSKVNADKILFGASLAERLWMLKRFVNGRPRYSVVLCSHARFVDKAQAIRATYPQETQIYFIVGYDTLVRVFHPKYYTDMEAELAALFAASEFIAVNRGENGVEAVKAFLEQPVCRPYTDKIHLLALDPQHARLSSTQVRERLKQEMPVTGMVPAEIEPLLALTALVYTPRYARDYEVV